MSRGACFFSIGYFPGAAHETGPVSSPVILESYLALRLSWPPRALVLSVLLLIFSPLGSIALRLLWAGIPTALRPVAFDIVFDFVIPRFPLGEVGARESEEPGQGLGVKIIFFVLFQFHVLTIKHSNLMRSWMSLLCLAWWELPRTG